MVKPCILLPNFISFFIIDMCGDVFSLTCSTTHTINEGFLSGTGRQGIIARKLKAHHCDPLSLRRARKEMHGGMWIRKAGTSGGGLAKWVSEAEDRYHSSGKPLALKRATAETCAQTTKRKTATEYNMLFHSPSRHLFDLMILAHRKVLAMACAMQRMNYREATACPCLPHMERYDPCVL